jgi:serine/threonine-protein kinase
MASPATDVFLSYKAEDRARLVPLVQALEAEGFSVWWDAQIGGGSNWHEDIERHLNAAKCVIVAWSKRAVGPGGQFVRDEARRAQRRGAYVPIRLDPVEPPLGFGEIQALSLKGWKGDRADLRFQALADSVRGHVSGEHVSRPYTLGPQPLLTRRGAIAALAGVAVAAPTAGWFLLRPGSVNAKRIAVLPFANLSGADDQAYFAEGIAEELRSALSRLGLQVIGRASSDAVKDLDSKAAATKLGVANILTGSVRRSARMVRINAQLVGGSDGVEHWAQSYDRAPGDEINIQTDIAANVAQALSIVLGQAARVALKLGGTTNSAAQDFFLRATALYDQDTSEAALRDAIRLLDAAVGRDPNYANAYRLKARALELLGTSYPKSAAEMADTLAQGASAARRAIALAPKFGPAYAELALIEQDRFNFANALEYIDRALALSPDDPLVLPSAMYIRRYLGDPRQALLLADRLVALDPLNPVTFTRRADVLMAVRQFPAAIESARKSLQLAPDRSYPHQLIGDSLVLMDRPNDALAEYKKVPVDDVFRLAGEAIVQGRSHDAAGLGRTLAHMRDLFGDAASYNYAQVYAQAGDKDRAFATLNKALEVKDAGLTGLKTDPFLDPIRSDPRYAALLKRLNFPART